MVYYTYQRAMNNKFKQPAVFSDQIKDIRQNRLSWNLLVDKQQETSVDL